VNENDWIPANEELPKRNKHVLLCLKNGDKTAQVVGYLFFNDKINDEYFNKFNDEFSVYNGDMMPDFLEKKYVLAWQPLPEPYKL